MKNVTTRATTLAILSISLLPMTTGVVASATPKLMTSFPTASTTTLNLVVTIPSFAMMVMVLISGALVKHCGSKRIVLSGLAMVSLATIIGMLAPNVQWLLAARLLLGVGLGLYNTLAVSLISRLFQGPQRQRLLGYQNATQGFGALLGALVVAALLLVSWRWAYGFYLISIPLFFGYAYYVPEVRFADSNQTRHQALTMRQGSSLVLDAGCLFGLMTFYMLANLKLPAMLVQHHWGDSSTGALLLVVMAIGTIVAGISYRWFKTRLQRLMLVFSSLSMIGGYVAMLVASASWALGISALLVGTSFGWLVPELFGHATQLVPASQANFVTIILMTSSNLANFAAPFVMVMLTPSGSLEQFITRSLGVLASLAVVELLSFWWQRGHVVLN
ncbi:MFS transporter [Lactiplantibacillus fabifermentans]|uniref:Transporter, major facilitator family protein n=2 Tax=Lactiplantibacillus fabifermentans TaxID=483011 RepID=A0A0R2NQS6_9LACO|nr:MFS transporter [Lactiplantibacillus fabifermentans]ETY72733.1 MFS transporter [Lactiplantibacillus fabifermentans T30PCM01]KRO28005.1 transporter, major facilitator family protein [Lactiplantibacillus fabifermentans DSM 21115]